MSPASVAGVLVVLFACLAIPVAAVLVIGEAIMRAGERRARLRAAREGARRTTLGVQWVAHQDQRQAARQLRDGGR